MSHNESLRHIFRHSWRDCVYASWKKWPNAQRSDVISIDLINKDYDEETGILRATRLIMIKTWIPNWLRHVTGSNICFFVEESITNPRNEQFVLKGNNCSFNSIVDMEETCIYTSVIDENIPTTHLHQRATITAHTWGLSHKLERFCYDRYIINVKKGRGMMEELIQQVKKEI